MAKFDMKALLDKHTTDGEVNYEAVNAEVQEQVNGIVAKAKPNMEELTAQIRNEVTPEIHKELFKAAGLTNVENLDQFNAHVKTLGGSTDEAKEANARLQAEINALTEKNQALETENGTLKSSVTTSERKGKIAPAGLDPKYTNAIMAEADALIAKAAGSDTELSYDEALVQIAETMPVFKLTGTQEVGGGETPPPGDDGEEEKAMVDSWLKDAGVL